MRYYRLYFLDEVTRRIRRFADFEAPDDRSALILADEHRSAGTTELWCGDRRVAVIESLTRGKSSESSPSHAANCGA